MPTLFLAGAAAGGAVLYDQRDPKTILHDVQLAPQAREIFAQAKEFRGQSALQFHSYNQNLLITGEVSSIALQQRVSELAHKVPLAKHIFNQTQVTAKKKDHHDLKDTWIATQARSLLLSKKGIRSNDFKIVAHNKIVYLMGNNNESKMHLAAGTLSKMHDVKKVVEIYNTSPKSIQKKLT